MKRSMALLVSSATATERECTVTGLTEHLDSIG